MTPADLVSHYGYAAVAVGTFFEGELIMLAAGVAASAGLLSLPGVIAAGMAGIFASDTFCFLLGRLFGARLRRWFPGLYRRAEGIFGLVERYQEPLIVYFQFFPGLCTVTPLAFGMTRIPTARFLALDLVGNVAWTLAFSLGGYACGASFDPTGADSWRWRAVLGGVLAGAGLLVWWGRRFLARRLAPPVA